VKIKKKESDFNTYVLDVSYGELIAMERAMADNHAGPVADELYAGIKWYLDRLPEPGEEESDEENGEEEDSLPLDGEPADVEPNADGADDMLPSPDDDKVPYPEPKTEPKVSSPKQDEADDMLPAP